MARPVRINRKLLMAVAVSSPVYQTYQHNVADQLIAAAIMVYNMKRRGDNEPSELTPPSYVDRFEIHRDGDGLILINTRRYSVHIEWGAHAGGKTPVLAYKPMTTAIEIVRNREGVVD